MTRLRVAICQMRSHLNDTGGNIERACEASRWAAEDGARLILLPEGCLTGNALRDPACQQVIDPGPESLAALIATADRHNIAICAGFAIRAGTDLFTLVHAAILPGQRVLLQHKAYRASTEPPFLTPWPDPQRVVFSIDGIRIVIAICSELGTPAVNAAMADAAPHLVLHPSAGKMPDQQVSGCPLAEPEAVAAFAGECRGVVERAAQKIKASGLPRLASNPVGFDGETWWPGNSYAVTASGEIALWLPGENHADRMVTRVGTVDLPVG